MITLLHLSSAKCKINYILHILYTDLLHLCVANCGKLFVISHPIQNPMFLKLYKLSNYII